MTNHSKDVARNIDRVSTSGLNKLRNSPEPHRQTIQDNKKTPKVDVFCSNSFNELFKNL